jgi:hypothetical protein
MNKIRLFAAVAIAAASLLVLASDSHAQVRRPLVITPPTPFTTNYYLPDGTNINQYAYNISVLGQAYSQIPPWILGYNPYPSPVYSPYPPIYPITPSPIPTISPPPYVPRMPIPSPTFLNPAYYTNPFFSFLGTYP